MSQVYYLIRSKTNGRYLTAHIDDSQSGYLLLFNHDFDALSYLNAHARDLASSLGVESIVSTQLGSLLKRWDFVGVGIVTDPLLPKIDFLQHS